MSGSLARAREVAEIIEARCLDRCAICYWPLAESAGVGCVRGLCSMVGDGAVGGGEVVGYI